MFNINSTNLLDQVTARELAVKTEYGVIHLTYSTWRFGARLMARLFAAKLDENADNLVDTQIDLVANTVMGWDILDGEEQADITRELVETLPFTVVTALATAIVKDYNSFAESLASDYYDEKIDDYFATGIEDNDGTEDD